MRIVLARATKASLASAERARRRPPTGDPCPPSTTANHSPSRPLLAALVVLAACGSGDPDRSSPSDGDGDVNLIDGAPTADGATLGDDAAPVDAAPADAAPVNPAPDAQVLSCPAALESFYSDVFGTFAGCAVDADCKAVDENLCNVADLIVAGCAIAVSDSTTSNALTGAVAPYANCAPAGNVSCVCAPFSGSVRCLDDLCTLVPESCAIVKGRYDVAVAPAKSALTQCSQDADCHTVQGGGEDGLGACQEVSSTQVPTQYLRALGRAYRDLDCSQISILCDSPVAPPPPKSECAPDGYCRALP